MRPALKKSLLPIALMAVLFIVFLVIGFLIPEESIRQVVYDAGPFGPMLLVLFFWLANFFAPLSGSPFLFAGFYLYGRQVVFYATVSAILASISNFLVAKKWGRGIVIKLAGEGALQKVDRLSLNYGLPALFISRLFFKEIHDVISYAFGLTPIKFWQYFVVSTLGFIPPTLLWYFVSGKLGSAVGFTFFSWLMVYIPLVVYFGYRKLVRKK